MSDLLEQATRALRETSAEPELRSGLTRARIVDGAHKRYASRRGGLLRWVVIVAAALATSTALARVAHYWPEIKRAIAPVLGEQDAAPESPRKHAPRKLAPPHADARPKSVPEPEAAPPPIEEAAPSTVAAPEVAAPAPAARAPRRPAQKPKQVTPEPEPAAAEPAPSVVKLEPPPATESAELALFRRAQRLHLNRDPRALDAWDDYLRVAGEGVLAPEARYNRALCLIRLGRAAEAKAALRPFASGVYGYYRRAEANALLGALQ